MHVIQTGHGTCLVDRWPEPKVILIETAGNYTLLGEVLAITAADLQPHIKGFVETSEGFLSLLQTAFSDIQIWPRVIFSQQNPPDLNPADKYSLRCLELSDLQNLNALTPESAWISKTWGGPEGLAASGFA